MIDSVDVTDESISAALKVLIHQLIHIPVLIQNQFINQFLPVAVAVAELIDTSAVIGRID